MTDKPLNNIQGPPANIQGIIDMQLPKCVKTQEDMIEMKAFIDQVVKAVLHSLGITQDG